MMDDFENDDFDAEREERRNKIVEFCDEAIGRAHKKLMGDKKAEISTKELKELMFIVREAHYLTMDDINDITIAGLEGQLRQLADEDDDEEDDYGDEDDEEDDEGRSFL